VNNVGPFLERPLAETTDAEWRRMVDGNLGSAFFCARAALPAMRARRSGCIINVSALNAEVSPGMTHEAPAYFVAKTALAMMTKSMARLEGRHNIRVNAVSPGFIETESYADWDPVDQDRWRSQIPLGRFGRPEEVAEAVAFLASERAAYISGTVLHVHGGLWI
jgi:3-oxoacyl-[acyl-carrier protein] reductase